MLATDGSLPALAATVRAFDLARDRKAKLVVLSVREQTPATGMEKMAEDTALLRVPGIDGIEYARKVAGRTNVKAEFLTREGPVVGEIVRAAGQTGADMIVLGSSDPKGISGFLLGNVAEALVRQSACTVLVVKPTPAETKAALELANGFKEAAGRPDISDITGSPRFKLGLGLFGLYIGGYVLFTLAGSFDKALFGQRLLGLNVALVSGMALILAAIAMAIGYNWYAGRKEPGTGGM